LEVWDAIPRLSVEETSISGKTLRIRIRRLNRTYMGRSLIYAPKFPKQQQESWFVLACDSSGERLLALQRLTITGRGGNGSAELSIPVHFNEDTLVVKVLSDGWRGVDYEKRISWKSDQAQEKSEGGV
jgi:antiviral helicase SLH1